MRDEFSRERRRKPLHPRANQGLGLVLVGITVGVVAGFAAGWPGWAAGGVLVFAGVVIYAASPSWIDWTPPEGYKGWTSRPDQPR